MSATALPAAEEMLPPRLASWIAVAPARRQSYLLKQKTCNLTTGHKLHRRVTKKITKANGVSEVFYIGIRHERIWA